MHLELIIISSVFLLIAAVGIYLSNKRQTITDKKVIQDLNQAMVKATTESLELAVDTLWIQGVGCKPNGELDLPRQFWQASSELVAVTLVTLVRSQSQEYRGYLLKQLAKLLLKNVQSYPHQIIAISAKIGAIDDGIATSLHDEVNFLRFIQVSG